MSYNSSISLLFLTKGPAVRYIKMPMATSLARFMVCSNHELIETSKLSHSGGNSHFGGTWHDAGFRLSIVKEKDR
jgi:hypothetical protein